MDISPDDEKVWIIKKPKKNIESSFFKQKIFERFKRDLYHYKPSNYAQQYFKKIDETKEKAKIIFKTKQQNKQKHG